jgi:predicted transcriptional regulator
MRGDPAPQSSVREDTQPQEKPDFAHEAKLIEEARADIAAGRTVSLEAIEAWVESWDTCREMPPSSL